MSDKVIYHGSSMSPTFKNGDILYVAPYKGRKVMRGDVVVFYGPQNNKVVHRVTAVTKEGVRTQGDNNTKADIYILTPEKIIGRVNYAERKKKRFYVYGGFMGRLFVAVRRAFKKIDLAISLALGPAYRFTARTNIIQQMLPPYLKPKLVKFNRGKKEELQLVMGSVKIAHLNAQKNEWCIRRPFRLVVDKEFQ